MINPNAGEVSLTLNEEDLVLKPTMRAATMVSRQFGGYAKARQAIVDENLDAVIFLIKTGTNMTDRQAKDLGEKVYQNGLDIDLLIPLIKYVAILNNGGRPLPEDIEGDFNRMTDQGVIIDQRDTSEGNG